MTEILVCPDCDHTDIHRRTNHPGGGYADTDWRCGACGNEFDDPHVRESKTGANMPTIGLARTLALMGERNE